MFAIGVFMIKIRSGFRLKGCCHHLICMYFAEQIMKVRPKGQKVKERYEFDVFHPQNGHISQKLVYFAPIGCFK
jgi:hypothetical protein